MYSFFSETAQIMPGKIAVIDGERKCSFEELQEIVHSIAASVLSVEPSTNSVIAVLMRKSLHAIASNLAISAVGCAYMNLDVKSPVSRMDKVLKVVQPKLIITDNEGEELVKKSSIEIDSINVDNIFEDIKKLKINPGESRLKKIIDTDPYCIINTSGSTGVPKGVILNHRSFMDFVAWTRDELNVSGGEIIGSLSPIIFDIFSYEVCAMCVFGSTLCVVDDRLSPYPAKILEVLEKNKVSFIFWVPTILVNIANMGLLERFDLTSLRQIWFAGEVFPTRHLNVWYDKLKGARFVNLYGPIEITLDCTYFIVSKRLNDDQPLPIGYPCRNTDLLVLDEDGSVVREGEIGELYVRGTSLAMGYYGNHSQTKNSFIQNPINDKYPELIYKTGDLVVIENGVYYFKGRKDTMIKHLGYRIELLDIENAIISSVREVKNVCVAYSSAAKQIVAYCELKSPLTIKEMRSSLAKEIPSYMIPTRIEEVENMPMNPNGKIDRLYFNHLVNG
jgi:amino acid adenylation domain-containing protein